MWRLDHHLAPVVVSGGHLAAQLAGNIVALRLGNTAAWARPARRIAGAANPHEPEVVIAGGVRTR